MASTSPESVVEAPKSNSRQRFKPQLSCTFCRTRKLKCDRAMPCENCVKRNLASSCTYVHAASTRDKPQVQKPASVPKDVQSQVRRLEELVTSLMEKTNKGPNSMRNNSHMTSEDSPGSSETVVGSIEMDYDERRNSSDHQAKDSDLSLGKITIGEGDQANYVGSSHWTAILDNIAGLKEQLNVVDEVKNEGKPVPGPDLLVGSVRSATRAEILASLPPKVVTDQLMSKYFQTSDMGSSMLHKPTFLREYEDFWYDPKPVSITWIGLLYGLLTLSVYYENVTKSPSSLAGYTLQDPKDAIYLYHEKTIQYLVLGNYTEPGPYTIETLFSCYIFTQFRSPDALFGAFMLFALLVRAAMRLGYHRDASHFPNLSVFRGEMQRRLWATIVHLDLQSSLQVGLPRMIREGMYDTQPPRNLLDEDYSDSTTVLPLSRPDYELTSVGCANIKHKITKILGMIVDQADLTSPISYEVVMKLDKQLHDVYQQTPASLKVNNINDLLHGSPAERFRKATLSLTFQKARCILHRRFFSPSKTTRRYPYPYSMKSCVDAAMQTLQMQLLMYEESRPGGTLYDHRWRTSSLLSQDFLLAGMLLCLYVGHTIELNDSKEQGDIQLDGIRIKWSHPEMLQSLQDSCGVWEVVAATSKEAAKAVKTLKSMISRVERRQPNSNDSLGSSGRGTNHMMSSMPNEAGQQVPLSSSWVPTSKSLDTLLGARIELHSSFDSTGFETMDWELWDSQVHNNFLGYVPTDFSAFDASFNAVSPHGQYSSFQSDFS